MATPPDFSVGQVLTAAQMNAVGMWRVYPSSVSGSGATLNADGSISLSGANNVTINDIFPNDYNIFQIIVTDLVMSAAGELRLQLRSSVTVTTNYSSGGYYAIFGSTSAAAPNNTTFIRLGGTSTGTARGNATTTIYNPNLATRTGYYSQFQNWDAWEASAGVNTNTTAYTNAVLTTSTGTASCTIRIYGYNS